MPRRSDPYSGPWRRIRTTILERDNHRCRIQGPGCTTTATEVDHIIPLEYGGARYDPDNLRAACRHCNAARTEKLKLDAWRYPGPKPGGQGTRPHITLVTGPPAAGKTTWVGEQAKGYPRGRYLILDTDALVQAVGGTPWGPADTATLDAALGARGAIIRKLQRGELDLDQVWIISTNPRATQLFPHHTHHTIDPGIDTVLHRIDTDPHRPAQQRDAARAWYQHTTTPPHPQPGGGGPSRPW